MSSPRASKEVKDTKETKDTKESKSDPIRDRIVELSKAFNFYNEYGKNLTPFEKDCMSEIQRDLLGSVTYKHSEYDPASKIKIREKDLTTCAEMATRNLETLKKNLLDLQKLFKKHHKSEEIISVTALLDAYRPNAFLYDNLDKALLLIKDVLAQQFKKPDDLLDQLPMYCTTLIAKPECAQIIFALKELKLLNLERLQLLFSISNTKQINESVFFLKKLKLLKKEHLEIMLNHPEQMKSFVEAITHDRIYEGVIMNPKNKIKLAEFKEHVEFLFELMNQDLLKTLVSKKIEFFDAEKESILNYKQLQHFIKLLQDPKILPEKMRTPGLIENVFSKLFLIEKIQKCPDTKLTGPFIVRNVPNDIFEALLECPPAAISQISKIINIMEDKHKLEPRSKKLPQTYHYDNEQFILLFKFFKPIDAFVRAMLFDYSLENREYAFHLFFEPHNFKLLVRMMNERSIAEFYLTLSLAIRTFGAVGFDDFSRELGVKCRDIFHRFYPKPKSFVEALEVPKVPTDAELTQACQDFHDLLTTIKENREKIEAINTLILASKSPDSAAREFFKGSLADPKNLMGEIGDFLFLKKKKEAKKTTEEKEDWKPDQTPDEKDKKDKPSFGKTGNKM